MAAVAVRRRLASLPVMATLLLVATALAGTASSTADQSTVRRCGSALLEFMDIVCDGLIYDPYEATRPKRGLLGQHFFADGHKQPVTAGFLRPEAASQLLGKRDYQGGIVFECCYKACSIPEAQSYCP
ncbi:insulin-like isoform X3 [Haemaphysalis longicornis]